MSSAANHRTRSHRSHRMHYQAAGITRRQVAANSFHQRTIWKDMLKGLLKGLFRRGGREPQKTVVGEIADA